VLFRKGLVFAALSCSIAQGACRDRDASSPATTAAATAASDPAAGPPDSSIVATVGDERVTAGELRRAYARAKKEWRRVPAHEAPNWDVLKRTLLDRIIERRAFLAEARARGLRATDAQVEEMLRLVRAGYDTDRFDETLLEGGQTLSQFKEGLREKLLVDALMKRQLEGVGATEAEARVRFDAAPQKYALPEAVRALHIAVRTEPEARKLRARLLEGEPFEKLARAHSVSPDGKKGGDLGFFSRGQMPKVFEQTCFSLAPGKLSLVTPSEYGYHLFKVLEQRSTKQRTFDAAKADVLAELTREKRARAEEAFRREVVARRPAQVDASLLKRIR
jgi:parvulin-like peptidyl-prolyl isomerase